MSPWAQSSVVKTLSTNSNPYRLCDFEQVLAPLSASIFSSVKWGQSHRPLCSLTAACKRVSGPEQLGRTKCSGGPPSAAPSRGMLPLPAPPPATAPQQTAGLCGTHAGTLLSPRPLAHPRTPASPRCHPSHPSGSFLLRPHPV